jgi:hypothetical protein
LAVAGRIRVVGVLFWVPLMLGGGEEAVIARCRELASMVADRRLRGDLAQIALVFSELAGGYLAWSKGLEDWEMTESQVVNRWIEKAVQEAELNKARTFLLRALEQRFPGAVSQDVIETINTQPSLPLLEDWFNVALRANSIEEFVAVLRR